MCICHVHSSCVGTLEEELKRGFGSCGRFRELGAYLDILVFILDNHLLLHQLLPERVEDRHLMRNPQRSGATELLRSPRTSLNWAYMCSSVVGPWPAVGTSWVSWDYAGRGILSQAVHVSISGCKWRVRKTRHCGRRQQAVHDMYLAS
jgi:hypothetical protein